MPARLNTQVIIGHTGCAPEWKHKEGETPFCAFTVAVDRPLKGKEKAKQPPLWYRVVLFGHQAETAVKNGWKGMQVYVSGRFDVSEWKDRDGVQRYTLEIYATEFQMLGESITSISERQDAAIAADRQSRSVEEMSVEDY